MGRDGIIRRRSKRPRNRFNNDDNDDSDDEEEKIIYVAPTASDRRSIRETNIRNTTHYYESTQRVQQDDDNNTNNKRDGDDNIDDNIDDEDLSDDEIERTGLGFCCSVCTCTEHHKDNTCNYGDYNFIQPSETSLWHRRCCHNIINNVFPNDWLSPIEKAFQKAESMLEKQLTDTKSIYNYDDTIFLYTYKELQTKYKIAKRNEAEFFNEDTIPDPSAVLETVPQYREIVRNFHQSVQRKKSTNTLEAAVVVEMFGGIGSGTVALKLLGIGMKKIIHVDHDKVATHVYRWNHDPLYNPELLQETCNESTIEHVHYDKFEQVRDNIDDFLTKHGPIDIIIGGPPCVDYSGANADRQGTMGAQGQYMVQFGELIKIIQQTQDKPLFFLAENTIIRNSKEVPVEDGDLTKVQKAFGVTYSIDYDSKDVSPCRRKRTYFTNIPCYPTNDELLGSHATISMCLDDGYVHPGNIFESTMIAKANCFMAHPGRINDDRMLVCKSNNIVGRTTKEFTCRSITTSERERAMGFPQNYVKTPVDHLFTTIQSDGFAYGLKSDKHWKTTLDPRYHHFSGNYHQLQQRHQPYDFVCKPGVIGLKLAAPQTTKNASRFSADGYAKHLIGNSFSVPTVAMLLRKLKEMYISKQYNGYDYDYYWTDQLGLPNDDDVVVANDNDDAA